MHIYISTALLGWGNHNSYNIKNIQEQKRSCKGKDNRIEL